MERRKIGKSNGRKKDGEKHDEWRTCLCSKKHRKNLSWYNCDYISPKRRPDGWRGKPEVFEQINKKVKRWNEGKLKWFINKFKYDGLEEKDSKDSKQYDLSKENTTKDTVKLGSFVAFSSFTSD